MQSNFTIKWLMAEDGVIKFKESDKTYDMSVPVAEFAKKSGLGTNDVVTVDIDEAEGDNGTVTKIVKSGSAPEQKKETPKPVKNDYDKPSSPQEENKKTVTIKAVAPKNKGIIFTDQENTWYTLSEEAFAQLTENKIEKRDTVVVSVEKREKGNDYILSIEKVKENVSEKSNVETKTVTEEPKKTTNDYAKESLKEYKKETNGVQLSIEAQAATNAANSTVATLFSGKFDANKPEDGATVKKLIESIATHNFEVIQKLKNSK